MICNDFISRPSYINLLPTQSSFELANMYMNSHFLGDVLTPQLERMVRAGWGDPEKMTD